MRATDRMTTAVVLAVFLAGFTLVPLTSDLGYLPASWLFLGVLGVATVVSRRARLHGGVVLGVQLVVGTLLSVLLAFTLGWPGGAWASHYASVWASGVEHMQTQGSPMDPNDGVTLIFATGVAGLWVVTDLLVSGLRRPGWAVAPLAALFLVPALGTGAGTGWVSFLLVAVGYLAVLVADGLNTAGRWTRGLSQDTAESVGAAPVVWRAAALVGVPAVVATLVLGAIVPTFTVPSFGFPGGRGGNGPLQLTDPSLDLRRNLNQPQDKEVIRYRTDAATGTYLRLASLPRFDSSGWGSVPVRLNDGADLPTVPGLTEASQGVRTTNFEVLDFQSQYLPMPYAPRSFTAAGDWRYDANSLTVVNGRNEAESLRNLAYSVRSVDVVPTAEDLAGAVAGTPADDAVTGVVPEDLPEDLIALTEQVTGGQQGAAAKASAIQAYLRSSRFTYSTEPLPGSGYRALQNFLLRDRRGYCEQFATSMAMMARIVNIPSRVSVGFLPGEKDGDTWRVTIRNMRAWPELYFAGYGWVRFEPTPASVTGTPPPWTQALPDNPEAEASPEPSASASADTPSASSAPTETTADPTLGNTGTATFPWAQTLAAVAGGLAALTALATPALLRMRRRNARLTPSQLAEDQVEAAWAEIRDTILDHGGSWPSGSPRMIGSEVAHRLEDDESAAIGQVATLVERSRYSRGLTDTDTDAMAALPVLTTGIRRGLTAPLSRRRRILGVMAPRSLFRRDRPER